MMRDYGPDGLIDPNTFTTVQFQWYPPYATPWGDERKGFYGAPSAPTAWFDGVDGLEGSAGSAEADYIQYQNAYLARQPVPTDVVIEVGGYEISGPTYLIATRVSIETGGTGKNMRIYMLQVLDHWPPDETYHRNGFKQAADTTDVYLAPGDLELIEYEFTFDDDSWADPDNIKIIVWAQEPGDSAPAEVHQAAVLTWPFDPLSQIPDDTPPEPDPLTWETPPTTVSTSAITMTATKATDDKSPPAEYFFTFNTGGAGGDDSGWQMLHTYVDDGLDANTHYTYEAQACDGADPPNVTLPSPAESALTHIETPTGLIHGAITDHSIEVTATGTFTNLGLPDSGLYFEWETYGGGTPVGNSGWIQEMTVTAEGLLPVTQYRFKVKARNQDQVETEVVQAVFSTTGGGDCPTQMGDANGDDVVDGEDVAAFIRIKLYPPGDPDDQPDCVDYGDTLEDDIAGFIAGLLAS